MQLVNYIFKRPEEPQIDLIVPFFTLIAFYLNKTTVYNYIALYNIIEQLFFRTIPFLLLKHTYRNSIISGAMLGYFNYYIYPEQNTWVFFIYLCIGFGYALSIPKYSPIEIVLHRTLFNILLLNILKL